MRRALPAIVAFVLTVAALVPPALTLPQHIDEVQYAYISHYYGEKIGHLDFSRQGTDERLDPGWDPTRWWMFTQPMGPRYVYAAVLGITQAPPPAAPWVGTDFLSDHPETRLTGYTRSVMRFTALVLAALGLALIVYRTGWAGVPAVALFLLIPHVREDLARGWAEGPLLFSFGLAALAWGRNWFAPACGLALLCKLTALPLMVLAFYHGFGHSRFRHAWGLVVAWTVWTVLMPPAWFMGGPTYLGVMIYSRILEFGHQSTVLTPEVWGSVFGHYFPTRYLWPMELAVLLAICVAASRVWSRVRSSARLRFA